jgi:hypothetical protein
MRKKLRRDFKKKIGQNNGGRIVGKITNIKIESPDLDNLKDRFLQISLKDIFQ